MTVSSMTGFGRSEGADDRIRWAWEARSVNGKSLDVRMRIPSGWEQFDPLVRKALQQRCKRGNFTVSLEIKAVAGASSVQVNEALLQALIARCEAFGETPRMDRLLGLRGVLEASEQEQGDLTADADRLADLEQGLALVLDRLAAARAEEGARIGAVIAGHIDEIEALVNEAAASADATPDAIRDRFAAQVQALLPEDGAIAPERLAQEVAVLAVKADVREELDRLKAHVAAARDLLADGDGIGRRFDFLCQEFNREANTLASKATALDLTRIGLNLKAVIDRLREQCLNLE